MTKKRKKNKDDETDLDVEWVKGTDKNLFLDKPFLALSNLSKKKKGKEVPVNVQISDYLKSMSLLENSCEEIEKTIEKIDLMLKLSHKLSESKIIKRKFKGKNYSTTREMINAVNLYERGKISYEDLLEIASWSRNPGDAIKVGQMIAQSGQFKKRGHK